MQAKNKRNRVGFAKLKLGLLAWAWILVLPVASAEPDRQSLEGQLAGVRVGQEKLDRRLEELLGRNDDQITALQARLTELTRQRPRPREAIQKASDALNTADSRTLDLIGEHEKRRGRLDDKLSALTRQLSKLPAERKGAPTSVGASSPDSPSGSTTRTAPRLESWGASKLLEQAFGADLGERGQVEGQPAQPAQPGPPTEGEGADEAEASGTYGDRYEAALGLTVAGGTADDYDRAAVALELAKLPLHMLERLESQGTEIVVVRDSVTEYRTDLRGVTPRGWPPGSTWDDVPGLYEPSTNQVIVATRGHGTSDGAHVPLTGDGHGSFNLAIHEVGHGLDMGARVSGSEAFIAARQADYATLSAYQQQRGSAGREETYAEVLARYHGGDPTLEAEQPSLFAFLQAEERNEWESKWE